LLEFLQSRGEERGELRHRRADPDHPSSAEHKMPVRRKEWKELKFRITEEGAHPPKEAVTNLGTWVDRWRELAGACKCLRLF
jgi:hypothetical protein